MTAAHWNASCTGMEASSKLLGLREDGGRFRDVRILSLVRSRSSNRKVFPAGARNPSSPLQLG